MIRLVHVLRSKLSGQNSRNAIAASLQVAFDCLVVMALYSIAFRYLSAAELGSWAFVTACLTFSRISDVTIAPTIVCFVAKQRTSQAIDDVAATILGGLTRVFIRLGLTSLLVMAAIWLYIHWRVNPAQRSFFLNLAVLSWFYTFALALATCVTAALDGLKRTDLRSGSTVLSNFVRIAVTIFLIEKFGIFGFALGLGAQASTLLLFGSIALWYELPQIFNAMKNRSSGWSDEMVEFGRRYQLAGILQMFLEPMTKAVFPLFADLTSLGYYDVATKFVQQIRAAILNPISLLLALFSSSTSTSNDDTRALYNRSSQVAFLVASFCFSSLICMLPMLSLWWIGSMQTEFVVFGCILSLSWGLNAFSSIAYYYLLAVGRLETVTRGNILMAVVNVVGGLVGGWCFGGLGAALGVGVALCAGSLYLIAGADTCLGISFHRVIGIPCLAASGLAFLIATSSAVHGLRVAEEPAIAFSLSLVSTTVTSITLIGLFHSLIIFQLIRLRQRVGLLGVASS